MASAVIAHRSSSARSGNGCLATAATRTTRALVATGRPRTARASYASGSTLVPLAKICSAALCVTSKTTTTNTRLSKTSTTPTFSVAVFLCLYLGCLFSACILVNPSMILICLGCLVWLRPCRTINKLPLSLFQRLSGAVPLQSVTGVSARVKV